MQLTLRDDKRGCSRKAFLLALMTAALIFIPFMVWDQGYFFFFGDFNVQQIPFYKLAHEAVRSGGLFWNWHTDLGVNFIGSYSFYMLGSPFFWLTLPFPTSFVPYLMGPLLILKHACAAFTGCLYLKRFVRRGESAVLGGLLYAFSGYAIYNVFFNHFHEAIVFFPLLLVAMEELVVNNRRGLLALAIAINAMVNYWFFIGEVVFVLLYFIVRCLSPDWRMNVKRFLIIAFESIVGMLLIMFIFLPSVAALLGNPRTGADELLTGWGMWLYWHNQLYPAIVSSAFFPPDLPSRPNLFPDRGAKWSSLSAWLPLVSMAGVLAYLHSKRDWLRRILLISFVFALVPILNSMFILFNNSYYARWFYMPVLLMSLASVRALETPSIDLRRGLLWTGGFTLLVPLILALTPKKEDGELVIGLYAYTGYFIVVVVCAILSLGLFALIWVRLHRKRSYFTALAAGICCVSAIYGAAFITMGKFHADKSDFIRDIALDGRYELEATLDQSTFARADLYQSMDNLGMYWHLPNIQAFHSVVPPSIMEFYPKVGVKRDVSSKPDVQHYTLRGLLSVKWLFVQEDEEEKDLLPGFSYVSNQLGYDLYENDYFIPMGFTFDYYITESELAGLPENQRSRTLLRALVLPDGQSSWYDDVLEHMQVTSYSGLTETDYYLDCEARRATAADSFVIDNRGFTASINMPRDNMVFFSVPYEKGWTATVNGEPARVEKVNHGFMAVRAPAGKAEIRFDFMTPGLMPGILLSILGLFILGGYLLLSGRRALFQPLAIPVAGAYDASYAMDVGLEPAPEQDPFDTPPEQQNELADELLGEELPDEERAGADMPDDMPPYGTWEEASGNPKKETTDDA